MERHARWQERRVASAKPESLFCTSDGLTVSRHHRQEPSEGQFNGGVEDRELKAVADRFRECTSLGRLCPYDRTGQGERPDWRSQGDYDVRIWW
jgi:hypothetical protein